MKQVVFAAVVVLTTAGLAVDRAVQDMTWLALMWALVCGAWFAWLVICWQDRRG